MPAATISDNLINPWGISHSPTGPFWVSDNGTGLTTIYNGAGNIIPVAGQDAITIAAPAGVDTAAPTGQVFNIAGSGFDVTANGVTAPSVFLFATEDGTISGWAPSVDPSSSVIAVDNSNDGNGTVYKGLSIATTDQGTFLYAANFGNGTVDVFDSTFKQVNSFTDPNLPPGYAPFDVQVLNNKLYVTFALQDFGQARRRGWTRAWVCRCIRPERQHAGPGRIARSVELALGAGYRTEGLRPVLGRPAGGELR